MDTLEYIRQFRIFEYAIFDLAVSFLGIYLLSPFLSKLFKKVKIDIPKSNWLFLTLPLGILIHIIVGNITPMVANFLNLQGHYLLKFLILILIILGFRGIKIIKK